MTGGIAIVIMVLLLGSIFLYKRLKKTSVAPDNKPDTDEEFGNPGDYVLPVSHNPEYHLTLDNGGTNYLIPFAINPEYQTTLDNGATNYLVPSADNPDYHLTLDNGAINYLVPLADNPDYHLTLDNEGTNYLVPSAHNPKYYSTLDHGGATYLIPFAAKPEYHDDEYANPRAAASYPVTYDLGNDASTDYQQIDSSAPSYDFATEPMVVYATAHKNSAHQPTVGMTKQTLFYASLQTHPGQENSCVNSQNRPNVSSAAP